MGTLRSFDEVPPNPRPYGFHHVALIADGFAGGGERMGGAAVQLRTLDALHGAPLWVHLRDHGVEASAFAEAAQAFVARIRSVAPRTVISINTHVGVAEMLGTGVHLGARGPSVTDAKRRLGRRRLVSVSVHSVSEACATVEQGANAVFFSPVFPTTSKPDHPGVGLADLAVCCEAVSGVSVLALGGVTPARVQPCLDAGAQSVAVLSGILYADSPASAAARYHAHLQRR